MLILLISLEFMQPKLILVLVQELATKLIMVLAAELATVPGYYVLQD